MDDTTAGFPLTSYTFTSAEEAMRFLQRGRKLVVGVVVVTRVRSEAELPPDDPALAAIATEARELQGEALHSAAREATRLQEPPADA